MSLSHANLGAGLGVKPQHWTSVLACDSPGFWVEVHAENHMVDGGPRLDALDALRAQHPLSLHGVGLSIGGHAPIDQKHLLRLKRLVDRFQPKLLSEHLAWCQHGGVAFPDLLPVARTAKNAVRIADRIDAVQNALGRPIAIENPTHYLTDVGHQMPEDVFLNAIHARCGNQWLLDLTNVVISAHNTAQSAEAVDRNWVFNIPSDTVSEIHLAGFSPDEQALTQAGEPLWIDSHSAGIGADVRGFFAQYLAFAGPKPTLIEWDNDVPAFELLWQQRCSAQSMLDAAERAMHGT